MFRRNGSHTARTTMAAMTLMLATAFLAGCDDDDNPTAPIEPMNANLRALHLSPDAGPVDIFLNQAATPAVSNLVFEAGTGYLEVAPDSYRIDVSANGSSAGQSVLNVPSLALEENRSYTAVVYGPVAAVKSLELLDDDSGLGAGNIRVRAIHTAAAVGQVDIWNIPNNGAPATLYTDVDYGVAGGYMDLPAGAYTIGFDVDNNATPDVVFDLPSLPAGTVANVFAVSQGSAVFLIAQLQDGTIARINAK
jgi:hypothetical protein